MLATTLIAIIALAGTHAAPTGTPRPPASLYRSRVFHSDLDRGICLGGKMNGTVELQICGSGGLQAFSYDHHNRGQMYMSNPATGSKAMCVTAPNATAGSKLVFSECVGETYDLTVPHWVVALGSVQLSDTELCIAVPGNVSLGAEVELAECTRGTNGSQYWYA